MPKADLRSRSQCDGAGVGASTRGGAPARATAVPARRGVQRRVPAAGGDRPRSHHRRGGPGPRVRRGRPARARPAPLPPDRGRHGGDARRGQPRRVRGRRLVRGPPDHVDHDHHPTLDDGWHLRGARTRGDRGVRARARRPGRVHLRRAHPPRHAGPAVEAERTPHPRHDPGARARRLHRGRADRVPRTGSPTCTTCSWPATRPSRCCPTCPTRARTTRRCRSTTQSAPPTSPTQLAEGGEPRVLVHNVIAPNFGPLQARLDDMAARAETGRVAAFKVYTAWGPGRQGYSMLDPAIGIPVVEQARVARGRGALRAQGPAAARVRPSLQRPRGHRRPGRPVPRHELRRVPRRLRPRPARGPLRPGPRRPRHRHADQGDGRRRRPAERQPLRRARAPPGAS